MYMEMLRDPRATRLLDFVNNPDWTGTGSLHFESSRAYDHVDEYRHLIRHLALKIDLKWVKCHLTDWAWPLKVDWKALPNLETLYLDFKARWGLAFYTGFDDQSGLEKLTTGAKRMRCLKLKRLVLVGLCSHEYWGNEATSNWLRNCSSQR